MSVQAKLGRCRSSRLWRGVGTALGFIAFGLCALTIGWLLAPPIRLVSRDSHAAQRRVRRLVRLACRGFIDALRRLGVIDVRIDHTERLDMPGRLLLANHPSLIDALFLLASTPDACCIVKGQLADSPILRRVILAAGYITTCEPRTVVGAARRALAAGRPLLVFPEGTRSLPGQPVRLQRGAAAIALASGAWITPVRIRCAPATLTKGEAWYRVPPSRPCFHIEVGAPLAPLAGGDASQQAARDLTRHLEDYFNSPTWEEGPTDDHRAGTRTQAIDHRHPGTGRRHAG
ncbi:lysophospholipid acyltransferase family protein [Halomonas sp. HP20-15]|uniref:lysophospholipid acyltransferase family protein n=1 Tax=Halomonas sp. HP20-15 TaxID=3085901 RepID=UPI002980ADC1|nr:lysophospholipid acyltransferase family protein [Halomonas sp. HP20-15]MDW5377474.1 lysophospholipid acyltransferase family protein [Halomonas sp. HP20-15]